MISAEIVHGIQRSKVDPLRDFLASFDFQGRLGVVRPDGRNRLTLASRHLKSEPRLPIGVMKIDIAASQICDAECRHDRFISDVLQSL